MKKILNKVNSEELLQMAAELLQAAFASQNMSTKYKMFNEANDLKTIAKILWKYEEMQQRGDL